MQDHSVESVCPLAVFPTPIRHMPKIKGQVLLGLTLNQSAIINREKHSHISGLQAVAKRPLYPLFICFDVAFSSPPPAKLFALHL